MPAAKFKVLGFSVMEVISPAVPCKLATKAPNGYEVQA